MASTLVRAALRRTISNGVAGSRVQIRTVTSSLRMPAMSPTMTEGGIAGWKKQEGESFVAGDVLLEIETDKATIDVEAQDDGIMGKILLPDGSKAIPVGKVIAVLAEEGDDLGSIKAPEDDDAFTSQAVSGSSGTGNDQASSSSSSGKDETSTKTFSGAPDAAEHHEFTSSPSSSTSSASTSASAGYGNSGSGAEPQHVQGGPSASEQNVVGGERHGHGQVGGGNGRAMFPSVARLLTGSNLSSEEIASIKGTGRNGMLTKGDVLFALGKIKSATGSASKMKPETIGQASKQATVSTNAASAAPSAPAKPLTGSELRRLILQGMEQASKPARPLSVVAKSISPTVSASHDFDALLEPYSSLIAKARTPHVELPSLELLIEEKAIAGSGIKLPVKDEWEGLY